MPCVFSFDAKNDLWMQAHLNVKISLTLGSIQISLRISEACFAMTSIKRLTKRSDLSEHYLAMLLAVLLLPLWALLVCSRLRPTPRLGAQ